MKQPAFRAACSDLSRPGRPAPIAVLRRGRSSLVSVCCLALIVLATLTAPVASEAATIWNGPRVAFAKANGADPTVPANQDRLTPNVWLTRGQSQGLYNIKTESSFTHFLSPTDTEWANGTTANYSSLAYTDWNTWVTAVNPTPFSTVGVDAVLHLISEDIYIDIKFTSWGVGAGNFSYERAQSPPPARIPTLSDWGLITLVVLILIVAPLALRRIHSR